MADFNYNLLLTYGICFVAGLAVVAFMLKGFFLEWWRVKRSGGSKVLVNIKNPLQNYYKVGSIDNGFLHYTARKRKDNKDPSRMICITNKTNDGMTVYDKAIYKSFGVFCIDVDDVKNCVMYRDEEDYKSVSGYNAELMDEALKTALRKPSEEDGWTQKDIIIVVGLAIVLIGIYVLYDQGKTLDLHNKLIYDRLELIYNSTVVN